MKKIHIIIAGISGLTAVALGAFGAHGLKTILNAELLEVYKTGVLYHLIHSAVLLTLSFSGRSFTGAFWFLLVGIVLFSFSLYIYSITELKIFVFLTPIGGISFLIGWSLIVYNGLRKKD